MSSYTNPDVGKYVGDEYEYIDEKVAFISPHMDNEWLGQESINNCQQVLLFMGKYLL